MYKPYFLLGACAALIFSVTTVAAAATSSAPPSDDQMRTWIEQMQESPRGPFRRIRWFCEDGAILPPEPYACRGGGDFEEHGGGVQHGEWTDQTKAIRSAGYPIANFLVQAEASDFSGSVEARENLKILLLEQFLIAFDDGWILRQARDYRGALQAEQENAGARRVLGDLVADPQWWPERYLLLREAARLLPRGVEASLLTDIRGLSNRIAEQDTGFTSARNKIHVQPSASDAGMVRDYAKQDGESDIQDKYTELADLIDAAYERDSLPAQVKQFANDIYSDGLNVNDAFSKKLLAWAEQLLATENAEPRLALLGKLLVQLRDNLKAAVASNDRVAMLDLSLRLEVEAFVTGQKLLANKQDASRSERLQWLRHGVAASYGMGVLTQREAAALNTELDGISQPQLRLAEYRDALSYLERLPLWANARLDYWFGPAIETLARIEPKAHLYKADRLRAAPTLFYANVIDGLRRDADALSGIQHEIFGEEVSGGLYTLNPGLARGVLHDSAQSVDEGGDDESIYLVPETAADLPPVSGILTANEGNALSHVQLLARNLGVPNVVVAPQLLAQVREHTGEQIVVAASPGGVVRIAQYDDEWRDVFEEAEPRSADRTIRIDTNKLDLENRELRSTLEVGTSDSGVSIGPKAAEVAALQARFPEQVPIGLTIPFGVYRDILRKPIRDRGPSIFEWMQTSYAELAQLKSGDIKLLRKRRSEILGTLRKRIENIELSADFKQKLRERMREVFGAEGSYGVFIRSDTNVEDLPGFTGAGLNLTVPNVVGFDAVVDGIKAVWASPFTERAFGWRQGLMQNPEHVYVAVLLHKSIASEKSGVMITSDIDTGARDTLSIAANLGVGGAVAGQVGEGLRLDAQGDGLRLLSSASDASKTVLDPNGGVRDVPALAPEVLIEVGEREQLQQLAQAVPQAFPEIKNAAGEIAPADIEFGFVDGKLKLFQIRPFLVSDRASRNAYLADLDRSLKSSADKTINMNKSPNK